MSDDNSVKASEKQVGGDHYKGYKIQPLEFFIKNNIPYAEGAIIKYVMRWRDKGGVEDLKKAKHIIDFLIEGEEEEIDERYEEVLSEDGWPQEGVHEVINFMGTRKELYDYVSEFPTSKLAQRYHNGEDINALLEPLYGAKKIAAYEEARKEEVTSSLVKSTEGWIQKELEKHDALIAEGEEADACACGIIKEADKQFCGESHRNTGCSRSPGCYDGYCGGGV